MKNSILYTILLCSALISCSGGSSKIFSEVTGKEGELMICWSNKLWKTDLRDSLNSIFVKEIKALPTTGFKDSEKTYKLMEIDPSGFGNVFKKHRNVLKIEFNSKAQSGIKYKMNVWAKPQSYATIVAKDSSDLKRILSENKEKLYNFFWNNETLRIQKKYKKQLSKSTELLKKEYNLDIAIPSIYNRATTNKGFEWFQYVAPGISQQHIYIFSYDYTATNTFTKEYLINKLNEVLKANVKGPNKGSYMTVDEDIESIFKQFSTPQSNYVAQIKGLWELEKGFMGGPFIYQSILDEKNNKVIGVCASIFAPQSKKRNLVRELESILLSVKTVEK